MTKPKFCLKQTCLAIIVLVTALLTLNWKANACSVTVNPHLTIDTGKSHTIVDSAKFSIEVPDGWDRFNKTSQGFNILFLMAPRADNFASNINILLEDIKGMPVDEYLKISIENIQKAGMVKDGSGDFDASNCHGTYITSSMDYNGISCALKSYVFIKDGTAYVVTGTCLASQKDKFRQIFDDAVKTLKIK